MGHYCYNKVTNRIEKIKEFLRFETSYDEMNVCVCVCVISSCDDDGGAEAANETF